VVSAFSFGCLRLTARYLQYGRTLSNTFTLRTIGSAPPRLIDLTNAAQGYLDWELVSVSHPNGYSGLRGTDSVLDSLTMWSIDPRSDAVWTDRGLNRVGLIPAPPFPLLQNVLCPSIQLRAGDVLQQRGRLYAVGLTQAATDGSSNPNEINALYRLTLESAYAELGNIWFDSYELIWGLLRTRDGGHPLVPATFYGSIVVGPIPATMNTQRRRIQHGRG